jgi:hypothetical protein
VSLVDSIIVNCSTPTDIQNEDATSTFFDTVIQTFLVRHGFLSGDVRPAPQKRRRVITGAGEKPDMGNTRQTSDSARSDTHGTMSGTRERYDPPSLHVNPVSKNVIPSVLVRISSSVQVDHDDENGVVRTDTSSGVTFLVDKRTDQSYPCALSSQESDEGGAQAIVSTRRIIAVPGPSDQEDEPPSWILDALKVGIACAGQRLETY